MFMILASTLIAMVDSSIIRY